MVFARNSLLLFIPCASIENLSVWGVSIVNADNSMAPSGAHESLTTTQESLLLLEIFDRSNFLLQVLNLLASRSRGAKSLG